MRATVDIDRCTGHKAGKLGCQKQASAGHLTRCASPFQWDGIYPTRQYVSPKVRALIDFLSKALKSPG